ncbi:MAG: hypothetical protein ABL929_07320 [Ferruginibacter sp.]
MKYNLILIASAVLLSTLLTANSCKKGKSPVTEEQLPPETHIGAFTIGFKVDGKIYTASGKGGLLAGQHVNYSYFADSTIDISIGNTESKFNLHIMFKYLGSLGIYVLKFTPNRGEFYDNSNGSIPGSLNTYTTDTINNGYVNIKYFTATIGGILAGTFEMNAINGNGKVIHITEGRFDIGNK